MKRLLMAMLITSALFIGTASASNAWEYGVKSYTYLDNGQLDGTCPGGVCSAKAASITNNSNENKTFTVNLNYSLDWIGNYQWGEDHAGGVIWHEIPMSYNTWSKKIVPGQTIYLRAVLREQNQKSGQWLIYHILSTPAVSHIFEKDGGGIYYIFPPKARFYNSNFQEDISGFVITAERN